MATTSWTDETLEQLRALGDRDADDLSIIYGDRFPRIVHDLLDTLTENDQAVPVAVPALLRDFLEDSGRLPAWADRDKIELGQHLFGRHGPQAVMALLCAALPECYAARKGAEILYLSPRLRRYTERRVLETAQFVLDIMAPSGLGPGGRGIRSAQKVRLLHAINRSILRRQPRYEPAWGVPINQEDLLGTLMAFSVVVVDSLRRLGIDLTPEQEEAYLHTWLVVGHLMGIDFAQAPADADAAHQLAGHIRRRHHAESKAGQELARALVRFLEDVVPGTALDGFVVVLIRHLIGDEIADLLAIPREEDWTRALLWPFKLANAVVHSVCEQSPAVGRVAEVFSRKFLEGVYVFEQGGQPAQFYIPGQLCERWGLEQRPVPVHRGAAAKAVSSM